MATLRRRLIPRRPPFFWGATFSLLDFHGTPFFMLTADSFHAPPLPFPFAPCLGELIRRHKCSLPWR